MNTQETSHSSLTASAHADPTTSWRERDLRGIDLRGLDLRGADFYGADLRGVDFTGAQLADACFAHTRSGLPRRWIMTAMAIALFATFVTGLMAGYASGVWEWFDTTAATYLSEVHQQLLSLTVFGSLLLSLWILVRRGLGVALGVFTLAGTTVCVLTAAWGSAQVAGALIVLLAIGVGSLLAATILFTAVLLCLQGIRTQQWPDWLLTPTTPSRFPLHRARPGNFLVLIALTGAVAGAAIGLWEAVIGRTAENPPALMFTLVLTWSLPIVITLASLVVSLFLARRALAGDIRFVLVHRLIIDLLTSGGTHFRGANLTGADFSHALLEHTDLREATLDGVRWVAATGLQQARTEVSYLAEPAIRALVTSNVGRGLSYDGLDISHLNLAEADLQEATFIGTDLTGANLTSADLTGAKLVHTQLYGANLRGATLTGAVIEEWAISTDTVLTDIHCDYIYLRSPTTLDLDPWRKPDNRQEIFKPGDFELFMAPIVKTLDLYRQQYVDPRAVKPLDLFHHDIIDPSASAAALRQLAEKHPGRQLAGGRNRRARCRQGASAGQCCRRGRQGRAQPTICNALSAL